MTVIAPLIVRKYLLSSQMNSFSLVLTALLIANSSVVWAQSDKDLAVLQGQSLVVVLKDEEPAKLKKLAKNPSELAEYKAFILDYNTQIEQLAQQLWRFSPAVEFKHESELPALLKDKSYQHGVLQHDKFTSLKRISGGAARGRIIYTSETETAFLLGVISQGTQRTIAQMPMAPGVVHTSDIILCLKALQYGLQERASGKTGKDQMANMLQNGKRLRVKTLLLDEAEISSKLPVADIKQLYPFPYQIVPRETIEAAVKNADARYACIRIMPVSTSLLMQVVMDVADGAILVMSPGAGSMSLKSGNVVDKNNLKEFAKAAAGK